VSSDGLSVFPRDSALVSSSQTWAALIVLQEFERIQGTNVSSVYKALLPHPPVPTMEESTPAGGEGRWAGGAPGAESSDG
jgi:hypothetical protein